MTTKNKRLGITRAVVLSIAFFFATVLSAQNASRAWPKDNSAIENDVSTIKKQKAEVDQLQDKVKADDRSGLKEMAASDKKELTRAHAALRKDRSYLMADLKDVRKDNRIAVRTSRKAIRLDKADLRYWRKHLRNAKKEGEESSIRFNEWQVKLWKGILDSDRERLRLEKDKRSYDRAFWKNEVKRLQGNRQGGYFASLYL